jgi:hypothetical protein
MDLGKLSLAEKDILILKIDNEINNRRKLILEKTKKITNKKKVNHFLEGVKEDYEKYYNYIVQEKQQQYNSMLIIKNYLDDLIKTEKMANSQLKNIKYDQNHILHEMDKIKTEMDKLILK